MADSDNEYIKKIDEFLRDNEECGWQDLDSYWAKRFVETHLKLLKTLVWYTGNWSDEDKAQHLGSLSTELEVPGNTFTDYAIGNIFRSYYSDRSSRTRIFMSQFLFTLTLQEKVASAYDYLLGESHPPIGDNLVFFQFVASVQEYLVCLPLELLRWIQSRGSSQYEWLPSNSSAVEGDYAATANKLESFKCFFCCFAYRCIDEEKLRRCLARAGALVLSVARVACGNQLLDRNVKTFPREMLRGSSDLSRKFSPHNPEVTEIYGEVLGGYVETIKAAKQPSPGPVISVASEDVEESYFNLLHSAEIQVDILGCILDYPLLDLVIKLEDCKKQVEMLLKRGVAAVVREAGSLSSCFPNPVLSKLLLKLNLVKAEIFVLELHNQKANLMSSAEDWVAAIREAFGFLSKFFKTPEKHMEDRGKLMLALMGYFLREARSLCDLHQAQEFTDDMIFKSSLAIFKLFKAEAMLMVLIDNTSCLKFLAKYRIETLHKGLIFLRALLSDPPNNDLDDGNVSAIVEALAGQATSHVCTFDSNTVERNRPEEVNLLYHHLIRKIELNCAEIKAVYQQAPWSLFSNFPKKDGVVFADFLLGELRNLVTNKPETILYMKDHVKVLLGELDFLRFILKDVQQQNHENEDHTNRVVCLIYEAEYIINLFVVGDVPVWFHQLVLFSAVEEAKLIKAQILEYYHGKEIRHDETVHNVRQTLGHMTLAASNLATDEVTVGLDEQAKIITAQLKTGSLRRQIFSIVGMPGLGKTTLAKKVYGSLSIQYHFTVRAWCYVSQVYRKRELLLDILGDFVEVTDNMKKMDDDGIAQTLYQSLKGKRYLIVMDDMWSKEPWTDLNTILPNDKTGSRILFTSRRRDMFLQDDFSREPHVPPLLTDEKSWELLKEKIFHGGICPGQLVEVGRRIAKNCKGLPLAIVVVAGLLKRTEKRINWWEEIAEHLRSRIADDQERQFMDILELSYNHLPSYLKPCFLYFGMFLEDQEIPVQKLKWLWIAEGFIPKTDLKSLEETAENYLVDLISRSLVMEAKRSSLGGTKTCRIHDMLRNLCLKKAKEENFTQLISINDTDNSESGCPSDSLVSMQYRVCVHSPKQHFIRSIPFGPHVHSLLFFATGNSESRHFHDVSFIFQNHKLLRVLDLEHITIDKTFPRRIEWTFCLNYLAVRGNINSVPSSIAELLNLETLIVKGTRGEIAVPSTLWTMPRLRHAQLHPRAAFDLLGNGLESITLDNLATLSAPTFARGKETEKLLKRMVGLKKLRCIFMEHVYRKCNVFPAMGFLTQLESLKIFYYGQVSLPCVFSFPKNLKKLTLSKFRLPWEYISAVRQLSNLEVLKLLSRAFEGETWDMAEAEFPNLKFLKLENLNFAKWDASSDSFPQLERLILQSCKKLEEIPSSFGEMPTLQMIEMQWCSQTAAHSVQSIYKQQLELENHEFKILITRSENF